MVYVRPGMQSVIANSPPMSMDNFESIKDRRADENKKSLVIFGFDISHWRSIFQYIFLTTGLILFMCLYGYYQELVQYNWFERKHSLFSTFLHFLFVSVIAQIQRNVSNKNQQNINNSISNPNDNNHDNESTKAKEVNTSFGHSIFVMGSAPPRVAVFYYIVLVLVKVVAQGMSNLSMTQINYPAKVLFKSGNPIITMVIGVAWFRKSYPIRDYFVVLLLVVGLYVFIAGDTEDAPTSTGLGILYVIISMFGSAGVPMIQEHVIGLYNASVEDLLYHSFLGSTVVSFVLAVFTGEFFHGVAFLRTHSSVHVWFVFIAFCTFGFCGANFGTALTYRYGALVNGITNTFRKAITLMLSFLLFPERNTLDTNKLLGSAIFFAGLMVRILGRAGPKDTKGGSGSSGGGGKTHQSGASASNTYARLNGSNTSGGGGGGGDRNDTTDGANSGPTELRRLCASADNLVGYNDNDDEIMLLTQARLASDSAGSAAAGGGAGRTETDSSEHSHGSSSDGNTGLPIDIESHMSSGGGGNVGIHVSPKHNSSNRQQQHFAVQAAIHL